MSPDMSQAVLGQRSYQFDGEGLTPGVSLTEVGDTMRSPFYRTDAEIAAVLQRVYTRLGITAVAPTRLEA